MARWLGLALAASAVWVFSHLAIRDFRDFLYHTRYVDEVFPFMVIGVVVIFVVFWAIFRDIKKST